MAPIYAPVGSVFFTRSSSLLGLAIRWAETDPDEEPTWANHTGVIVQGGWIGGPGVQAEVVEALWKTRRGPLKVNGVAVRVFAPTRPINLIRFRAVADSYVGATYGWWKLLFHLADRAFFRGRKVLSKTLHIDERPICSYLAAKVFAAVGVGFGVQPEAATPDEMMDYCLDHPDEWEEIR
jgi:hypothetical protein